LFFNSGICSEGITFIKPAKEDRTKLGIEANLDLNDKVVLLDTEQSKHDLQNSLQRMSRLINYDTLF
jgi:hypothetical protein